MKKGIQFGVSAAALIGCLAFAGVAWAQKAHADRPPQSHAAPAHPQNQGRNPNRPPANSNRPPANANRGNNRPAPSRPYANNENRGNNRPAESRPYANNQNRPGNGGDANFTPRQQMGAARPWVDTMRDLSPQQRERVLQNSRAFQNLSPDKQNKIRQQFNQWDHMTPQQRSSLRENEQMWRNLTPEQRDHIKNDVLPKWRQMPWDRQQVMKQKLGVLQNMPESARNQRLNDPNFTKGMSDDEKSMLRDLSHTHVGGPPDPPGE